MIISVGENISGYEVKEHKDIIFGVADSTEGAMFRQTAIKKISHAAELLGCNAVVNFYIDHYAVKDGVIEVTAYGNAAYVERKEQNLSEHSAHKVDLNAFIPREKSESGKIYEMNSYKFVVCPKCGSKYKADVDENGNVHVKGFDDVDDIEPGLQIFCLRCGTKFTVPEKN